MTGAATGLVGRTGPVRTQPGATGKTGQPRGIPITRPVLA